MQRIEAIICPGKLVAVEAALSQAGFDGFTVTEVFGRGTQQHAPVFFQGSTYDWDMDQRMKLEFVIEDGQSEQAIQLIEHSARTGRHGDGSIFITAVSKMI